MCVNYSVSQIRNAFFKERLSLRVAALTDRSATLMYGTGVSTAAAPSGKCYPIKYISSVGLCRAKPGKMFLFHRNARLPALRSIWRVAHKAGALIGLDCKSQGSYSMSRLRPAILSNEFVTTAQLLSRRFDKNRRKIQTNDSLPTSFLFVFATNVRDIKIDRF